MSKKIVSIHAYDCLGDVVYAARVREYPDYEQGSGEIVLIHTGVFPGEGISDPRQWLQDILIAMIERL